MTKKIALIILCFTLPLLAVGCQKKTAPNNQTVILHGSPKQIEVAGHKLKVELMDTDALKQQGLSGRDNLPEGEGMLFDFTNSSDRKPGFWMSEMKFDIDIIWIRDSRVIGVTSNIPRPKGNETLPLYFPPSEIDYVLEVPSGWSTSHDVKTNSQFNFVSSRP